MIEGSRRNIDNLALSLVSPILNRLLGPPKYARQDTEGAQFDATYGNDAAAQRGRVAGEIGLTALEIAALRKGLTNPLMSAVPRATTMVPNTAGSLAGQVGRGLALNAPVPLTARGIQLLGSAGEGALGAIGTGGDWRYGAMAGPIGLLTGAGLKLGGHYLGQSVLHQLGIPTLMSHLGPIATQPGFLGFLAGLVGDQADQAEVTQSQKAKPTLDQRDQDWVTKGQ